MGDAVVSLPCPSRVRTDVHGAVVDGFLAVVWHMVGIEGVVTKWNLVNASAVLRVDGVVNTGSK